MPGTPELVSFRAFIYVPRAGFADVLDDDRVSWEFYSPPLTGTFHSVDLVFHMDNCDEVKPEWLLMAELMSKEHFSHEVQQQDVYSVVIKNNLGYQSLGRFADVAVSVASVGSGTVASVASISYWKVAEVLRCLTSRSGDEQINEACLKCMNGQSDIYYVTGETTIAPMCPSDPLIAQHSMVALRKNGLVVTDTVDPLSGCAMQLLHKVPGTAGRMNGWTQSTLGRMIGCGAPCFIRPDDSDTSNSERCSTTGTGSSTTATGTTGQAAATKLHKA